MNGLILNEKVEAQTPNKWTSLKFSLKLNLLILFHNEILEYSVRYCFGWIVSTCPLPNSYMEALAPKF